MNVVRFVLAAPFGVLAYGLWWLGSLVAKLAMLIAGMGGHGPWTLKVSL